MAVDVEGPVDRVEAAMTDADASLGSGETKCLNCSEVLLGAYCRACGQKGGAPPLHFHDFVHELMHELLHFDAKIWRTLKLLVFSPGTLTREIIAGRRVRYVGAIRLFLVSSVMLFGLLAFSAHHAETEEQRAENVTESLAELDQKLADPTTNWFERGVLSGARKAIADPTRLADRIVRALSWSSFLLVPVFALVTWRCFKRQQPFYIAHVYFALHIHAFAFLLLSAMTVLTLLHVPFSALGLGAFGLATLVYFFVAIRRALNASWVKTLLAGSVALAICGSFNAVVIGASLVGTLLLG